MSSSSTIPGSCRNSRLRLFFTSRALTAAAAVLVVEEEEEELEDEEEDEEEEEEGTCRSGRRFLGMHGARER